MDALLDDRVDALLEDVTDALKEVLSSIDSLIQGGELEEGDIKKRLEKNNFKVHEVIDLIGYLYFLARNRSSQKKKTITHS